MFAKLTGYTKTSKQYMLPFILVAVLFFFWAFVHNINGTLIPHLKKALLLNNTQSSFIDVAIYFAYFLAALPAGYMIRKAGYKKTILAGLFLFALGAFLFLPAALTRTYFYFLIALFIFGFGAAFLETAANPYIAQLGDPGFSTSRLNLAQSFNGIGAFITPIIGSQLILSGTSISGNDFQNLSAAAKDSFLQKEANSVLIPYAVLGFLVLLMLLLIFKSAIPEPEKEKGKINVTTKLIQNKHLIGAIAAQFFYVGAQVGIASFFVAYADQVAGIKNNQANFLWGIIAMVGFMAGRFFGTFLLRFIKADKLLLIFSILSIGLLSFSLTIQGMASVYCMMTVPFFMSIMFPTIFDLGIKDTKEHAKLGSSLLIMSIVGGAVIPYFMAKIADATNSFPTAFLLPVFCFCMVALFALFYKKLYRLSFH